MQLHQEPFIMERNQNYSKQNKRTYCTDKNAFLIYYRVFNWCGDKINSYSKIMFRKTKIPLLIFSHYIESFFIVKYYIDGY